MAIPKFLLFFIFSTVIYTVIASIARPDSVAAGEEIGAFSELEASDASLRVELDVLKSKISLLGSKIDETMQELTSKDKTIKELEMIIEEKSNSLTSLRSQMQLLTEKASLNAKEQEGGAHERARELEEQINNLREQNKKKNALEARATIAERKVQDWHLRLEKLHKINDEQMSRILITQRALEVAEEELLMAKLEASSISKMFIEVTRKSIEPHLVRLQQVIYPYFQEAAKFTEPYVEQVSSLAQPQIAITRAFLRPYVENFLRGYKKFVKKVYLLHQQVQAAILDMLKGHEFTRPLAAKELVWYMASALMVLPLIFLSNMVSAFFPNKKPKKCVHTSRSIRHRAKRVHHSER